MLTFIVGLPASGKTTLGATLSCDVFLDEVKSLDQIKEQLHLGKSVVVTDPYLCYKKNQEKAKVEFNNWPIRWIFFENNPKQCLVNAKLRDKPVNGDIKIFSRDYFIPDNCEVLPVHSNKLT